MVRATTKQQVASLFDVLTSRLYLVCAASQKLLNLLWIDFLALPCIFPSWLCRRLSHFSILLAILLRMALLALEDVGEERHLEVWYFVSSRVQSCLALVGPGEAARPGTRQISFLNRFCRRCSVWCCPRKMRSLVKISALRALTWFSGGSREVFRDVRP